MVQENSLENKIIIICGPTGSGKSDLALEVAKRLDTEIISADSIAVYKGLDIGSAKPDKTSRELVKHHLIDVVSPLEEFSVEDYENHALEIVYDLFNRGKTPIICGGTGFYIDAVLYKKSYGNAPKNDEIRQKYQKILQEKGVDYLYGLLNKVDEESAKTIHKNNTVRVIRALEIYEVSGRKKSEIIDDKVPRFPFKAYMIDYDRNVLYERIDKRVDAMLNNGLIDEVKGLINSGITLNNQCMQGIGYKEVYERIVNDNYDNLPEILKLNTRHYAKRQLTYFNRLENLVKLKPSSNEELANLIIKENYNG